MAHSKGFSLIETLISILIASIVILALMRVVSYSSSNAVNSIKQFDASMVMGVFLNGVDDSMNGKTLSADDLLISRYHIEHPAIRKTLQETSYHVRILSKEPVVPTMRHSFNQMGLSDSAYPISVKKIMLQNSQQQKVYYRLVSDHL